MAGSDLGDDHKTIFSGDNALKAGGAKNTSSQFKDDERVPERDNLEEVPVAV